MSFTLTTTKLSILTLCMIIIMPINIANATFLMPHTAKYEFKIVKRSTGSPIANINGTMLYTIDDECDGWSTTQDFEFFYTYNDNTRTSEVKYFTNWEAKNSDNMYFTSKKISNGVLDEILHGTASKGSDKEGKAIFSMPKGLSFNLNNKTTFPNQYILELLEKAKNNEKFYNKMLFDGTDKNGAVEANSFIGKKLLSKEIIELKNNKNISEDALGKYAWKIRIAFFAPNKETMLPSHEIDMILHDNGVISSTVIKYNGFSVSETITSIKINKKPNC